MLDRPSPRWARPLAVLTLAACVVSCADVPRPSEQASWASAGIESSSQRERRLNQLWAGRSRAALEVEWGAPTHVIDVPGFRRPSTMVLIFTGRQPTGGCIDAFVVLRDDAETISGYVCR